MFSIDCEACPAGRRGCDGCLVAFLDSEEPQVDDLSLESCGYVLAPEVRAAIEVLRDVGVVSSIEIVSAFRAA